MTVVAPGDDAALGDVSEESLVDKEFPLFVTLAGRRVVAVGGGPVSARRVQSLLQAGAAVTVIAPHLCEDIAELVECGEVGWRQRDYAGPDDLEGAWFVHTATGEAAIDQAVSTDAEANRIFCARASAGRRTAAVPARAVAPTATGAVQLAVFAGGDPRRAVSVRNELATHLNTAPTDLRSHRNHTGSVALVGGGPGADDLLTQRGRVLLSSADVVVADRLAPLGLLQYLPEQVRVINVGKTAGHHPVPQDEINQILVSEAMRGNAVVRLKGGDPYVLGRGGEELQACREAGINVEVVPGITSAVAVPAAAGIPVTHRGVATGFSVVTGHMATRRQGGQTPFEPPSGPDAWLDLISRGQRGGPVGSRSQGAGRVDLDGGKDFLPQLTDLPTGRDHTLIVLMGVTALRSIAAVLIASGRDAECPVAVVERGCTDEQRTTIGRLETIADIAEDRGVRAPAVVVIGDVVSLSPHATEALQATEELPPDAVNLN